MLDGKAALVTGASGGIGCAIAARLAAGGAALYLVGRDPSRLDAAAEAARASGGASVARCPADLTDDPALDTIVANVLAAFGGVDILIHSAGAHARCAVAEADAADLDRLYRINLRVPFRLTQALLPSLMERQGDVVFVNSTQGQEAAPLHGAYAATRHGLKALADSLRAEVNDAGVRVLTVRLGRTATAGQEAIFAEEGRPYQPARLIQPADVAEAIVAAIRLPRTAEMTSVTIRPQHKP
jgi:NADP-dependent 3-hydroxy acid dehydrogenase YdfG